MDRPASPEGERGWSAVFVFCPLLAPLLTALQFEVRGRIYYVGFSLGIETCRKLECLK